MKNATIILLFLFMYSIDNLMFSQNKAFENNQKLGKGVNFGNALEAPNEGEWGVTLTEEYFTKIAEKGFNSVRIPIRWSSHALASAPYTINSQFLDRIDWAIQNSLKNKLMVIINMHHYDEIFDNPAGHKARFLSMWAQIAHRFSQYNDSVIFEPLNEPHGNLTAELWNDYLAEARDTIRKENPDKTILVGIAEWGGISALNKLALPDGEENMILTVHYYNPFSFTHQGAEWVSGSDEWLGTTWNNTLGERKIVENEFQAVINYASAHNIPVNVGEFGSYSKGNLSSRTAWTNFCARFFESQGFSWNYWEFCSGFGIYNATNKTWNNSLTNALLTDPMPEPADGYTGNLVVNGDFKYGKSNWSTYVNTGASASYSVSGKQCTVNITSGGTENWHVQLMNNSFVIEKGKTYDVEFEVKADKAVNIGVTIGMNGSPYTSYFDKTITTSTVRTKFSYQFTMNENTDLFARFLFNLGKNTGSFYFYNILVRESFPAGLKELNGNEKVKIYPNPTIHTLVVEGPEIQTYSIYNQNGQPVENEKICNQPFNEIDCSRLPQGYYFLKLKDNKGLVYVKTFVVNRN
ncbi:MAG: cellulase family glycosylhydrolase [Bacteroidales bacterium]